MTRRAPRQAPDAASPARERLDPARWPEHHFGLPAERWAALAGKAFWVVGAGTGYGRCVAAGLAAAGARVFLTGRREGKFAESLQEMTRLGVSADRCLALPADATAPASLAAVGSRIERESAGLTGLVYTAALPPDAAQARPLECGTPEHFQQLLQTNVLGAWHAFRAAWPLMRRTGEARTVFFSSGAGWAFTHGCGPYNVSKAALNSLALSLAEELADSHGDMDVQINVLEPGEARTEMNASSADSPYRVVSMTMLLLSHPPGGPNGYAFARDGRHLAVASRPAWPRALA